MATQVTDTLQRPVQIDYKLRSVEAPRYKLMKIPLNNFPAGAITVGPTSSVTLEWKLPTQVYNLARSYISYNIDVAASGAGKFNATFEDCFDLGNAVTFGSAGGVDLVNLQYAQNFTKIARKIATSLDDYLGNDDLSGLYKSNKVNGVAPAQAAASAVNIVPGGYAGASLFAATDNYMESRYMISGGDNTALDRYRQYPLGAFVGTLLGVDRDFYSPVEQYLRVSAGTGDKMAFMSTSISDPSAGAASPTGAITVNNIFLYLAVEQNQTIKDAMAAKYAAGQLTYRIPYTTAFKTVGGGANSTTNIQVQLSAQYGKRLKRILHTVFNPQEKFNTAYDCANWNGEKIKTFQTFMDSLPLQDRILSCLRPAGVLVNQDDWAENRKYLERRSCVISKEMYALNWFHIDQFYEPHDKDGSLPEVNLDEGIPMDTAKQWLFSAETGATAGLIHYTFAQFARDIAITPAGPIFVV